jgi:hypothetical protein
VPAAIVRGALLAALSLLAALLLGTPPATAAPADDPAVVSGVEVAALPEPARAVLPLITALTATACPELPPAWVVAQVQAESGWDASLTAAGPGGPAGLYQLSQANWTAAGGSAWPTDPPGPGSDVTVAESDLQVAVPWVCANLRAVTAHLAATGKPTAPLDAMLVCHIAGCARVTGSATGIPVPGEADCDQLCAVAIHRYVAAVHANLDRYSTPVPTDAQPFAATARSTSTPRAWTGGTTGCNRPDPTSSGCLTGATEHGLDAVEDAFGKPKGPVLRSAGCWDKHAWNPRSDHPRGRACDLFATTAGHFAAGTDLDNGWRMANWLRSNAEALDVRYLIWQGRYWDPGVADTAGSWGRRYTGGGVYDVRDATGGHYDHVHVSFRE